MAQLNLGAIKDVGGIGGFTFSTGGITANGTLTVNDIEISGTLAGSSNYILPNPSGNTDQFISNNGSNMTWGTLSSASGVRSMQVWTNNGTWTKPSGGYFVSFNTKPGLAKKTIQLALDVGLKLTPAGSTYPYGVDPLDQNIRLAPTACSVHELEEAMEMFITCVALATLQQET